MSEYQKGRERGYELGKLTAYDTIQAMTDTIEALRAENARLRNETLEEAARIAEKVRDDFLSEEYAVPQPIGSLQERFACNEVAAAIRAARGETE